MGDFLKRAENKAVGFVDFITKLPQEGHKFSSDLNEKIIDLTQSFQNTKKRSTRTAKRNLKQGKIDSLVLQFTDFVQTTRGMIITGVVLFMIYKILK